MKKSIKKIIFASLIMPIALNFGMAKNSKRTDDFLAFASSYEEVKMPIKNNITMNNYSNNMYMIKNNHKLLSLEELRRINIESLKIEFVEECDLKVSEYNSYEKIEKNIIYLSSLYSENITTEKLGRSQDGRNIYGLSVGNGPINILVSTGIHSRETANPTYVLKMIEDLVQNEKELLNKVTYRIIPCANPDGYEFALFGPNTIRRSDAVGRFISNYNQYKKSPINGYDLNRSFPDYYSDIKDPNYNGQIVNKLWENKPYNSLNNYNEVLIFMKYFNRYMLDPTINVSVFVDIHSAGSAIFNTKPYVQNVLNIQSREYAKCIISKNGYKDNYNTSFGKGHDGTTTDYIAQLAAGFVWSEKLGKLVPPNIYIDNEVYEYKRKATNNIRKKMGILTIETIPNITGKVPTLKEQTKEYKRVKDIFVNLGKKSIELNPNMVFTQNKQNILIRR